MAIVVKKYPKDTPFMPATQPEVGFEREGYYIIGWNPKEKRSETSALYRLDQAISFGSNQDLYACWCPFEEQSVLVTDQDDYIVTDDGFNIKYI